MIRRAWRSVMVALSALGSAILLYACGTETESHAVNEEGLMTEYSEDLTVLMSENGRRSYHFTAPQVEGYSLAREPYREFRKGVKIITYQNDSLTSVDVTLVANYAIYYENRKLWEAKGNVVVEKFDGKTLYTQQLFWNSTTGKIYSNVDSKIVQNNGTDVFIGEGFESDEAFKNWRFRRMKGRMEVDVSPTEQPDSAGVSGAPEPVGATVPEAGAAEHPAAPKPAATTGSGRPEGSAERNSGATADGAAAAAPPKRAVPEHGAAAASETGALQRRSRPDTPDAEVGEPENLQIQSLTRQLPDEN